MSGRLHDQNHFFKYASFKTAIRIIQGHSFQWSSPVKFNDPFDHQAGFVLDIDEAEFASLLTASIERIIFTDINLGEGPSPVFTNLLLMLRTMRDRLPRQDILTEIYQTSLTVAQNIKDGVDTFNSAVHSHLCHSRVFCVSEQHDNIVMWSHYADEHRGVVFKLRCIDAIDNRLLAARQVTYTDSFLSFPSANQYARHLTGEQPIDMVALSWNAAFTKHLDWSYEKEWRVHIPLLNEPEGDGYAIYDEDPQIFEAVYLGCRMAKEQIQTVVKAIQTYLPKTEIYLAERSKKSFTLSFQKVS